MPSFASGNRSCTAWASTCAVECRSTFSPSGESIATGSTGVSSSGAQERSRRRLSESRTTTIARAPVTGRPAAATASAAVVPAATRTEAATAVAGADTAVLPGSKRVLSMTMLARRPPGPARGPRDAPTGYVSGAMKVLITGGAGYIGSTLGSACLDQGVTPVILDNLSTGRREFVAQRHFFHGDIADGPLIDEIFAAHPDIAAAVHCAARIVVPESVTEPIGYYRN